MSNYMSAVKKYIIIEAKNEVNEDKANHSKIYIPLLFNGNIAHKSVGTLQRFINKDTNDFYPNIEIVGAGFFYIGMSSNGNVRVYCKGRSESLNVDSQGEEDAKIINKWLFNKEEV